MLAETLWRCRQLYHAGLEQRLYAYRHCGVTVTRYQQEAELKDLRASMPEYAALHSHVVQDVLARLDKAYQAVFRRVKSGQTPGFPRFQGRNRYHSFTYKEFGTGAPLDNGFLMFVQNWADGPALVTSAGRQTQDRHELPRGGRLVRSLLLRRSTRPRPCHRPAKETGIDVGLTVFLITAEGLVIDNPRHYRHAEKRLAKAQRRVSRRTKGSHRRRKAVGRLRRAHQTVQRQRADFHHKTALALLRDDAAISLEDLRVANLVRNRHLAKSISDAGWAAVS